MSLPFFKAGDVYEAWSYAYQEREKVFHTPGIPVPIPNPTTWNRLSPYEMQTYNFMAEFLNRQLEGLILEAVAHILLEEKERDHNRIQVE